MNGWVRTEQCRNSARHKAADCARVVEESLRAEHKLRCIAEALQDTGGELCTGGLRAGERGR